MRAHTHEENFPVSPEELFRLLHTPSAVRAWWGASRVIVLPETGGLWAATWGDDEDNPEYVTAATISVFDTPRHLRLTDYKYLSKDGPLPFQADFTLDFFVSDNPGGARLKVVQDGFPVGDIADDFYRACEVGWQETFVGIRRYLSERP